MSHLTNGCYWFYMILSDNTMNLEICIHTPDILPTRGMIEILHKRVNQGWLIEEGSCVQLSDIEPVPAILIIVNKLSQYFVMFHGKKNRRCFFHHTWDWSGFDWHWAILKRMTMVPLFNQPCLILVLDRKSQAWFSHHSGILINVKWGFPSITWRTLVSIRDDMLWRGHRC